ncbi:MAG: hypothetical protein CME62_03030 [Halobacteriovoraceae bacterium]|nr:hypothetical protein [Halobacteriovoraceae bacterium]|tara:strand:- start:2630 stop:3451 length:822 start_codon:yes stop_codon:yes gene_type:complete
MAKLILFAFLLFNFSCATGKKSGFELSQKLRAKLFSTQNNFEKYLASGDPLFNNLNNKECLADWEKSVSELNKKLRKVSSDQQRSEIWFTLGNCYNYTQEFRKSLYYYDLVLTFEKNDAQKISKIMSNIGLIYDIQGLSALARSYYQNSLKHNRSNHLANYLLSLDYLRQGNFAKANEGLELLAKQLPNSRVVRSSLGVSFVLSGNNLELRNKVLSFFNEKDEEAILLKSGIKLINGEVSRDRIADLKDLELKFSVLDDFRDYLITSFGQKNG